MDNVIMAIFPVESEAYQAFSELKRDPAGTTYLVSQAVLVKKDGKDLKTCDSFDTGYESTDDTFRGSMIGACIGILGGPIGMLLGMGLGSLTGAVVDTDDMVYNASLIENIASKLTEGTVAILSLAREDMPDAVDSKFTKFNAAITRYDAAAVEEEIEAADKAARELAKKTRQTLRAEKSEERKARIEQFRQKITGDFDALKNKISQ